jgi:competence protein ComEC
MKLLIIKNSVVWAIVITLILVRYYSTQPVYKNGDTVRISANVLSDPIDYSTSQLIRISGLRMFAPLFPTVSYGDRVTVEGVIDKNRLTNVKILDIQERKTLLSNLRKSIISFYQNSLPEPEAGLLAGITLGSKGALMSDFYNQTKAVGVAHIVVASGTNITFVASFLMGVMTLVFPRRKAILFVILGIILYLFLSGFDAPLIRAAVMSSFLFLGQESGRLVSTWRLLFLTGALMLIYNPSWLVDIGFILSFVSTASLMLFEKKIRLKLAKIPKVLKEGLSTSLAAQIGVAPILFVTFGQFNILSPIANTLVLPVVAPLMILGSLGGVVGLIVPFLGKAILWLAYPMLWWFTNMVKIFNF